MRLVPGLKAGASIAEALRLMAQFFHLNGIEDADADARILLAHALHLDRAQLLAQSDRLLEAREIDTVLPLAVRRLKREPVARILGRKEFWSLPLGLTPDVLVPRPETETIVEAALDRVLRGGLRLERLRVLDIGTGSGALLLALLKEMPNATGTGTDIDAGALACARANAERHNLAGRCSFVAGDMAAGLAGPFDLIVSNPPYVARGEIPRLEPEVRDYDPKVALDGGEDGLDAYRAIAAAAPRLLAPDGRLIVELGAGQELSVRTLFTNTGLAIVTVRNDLSGIPRALVANAP
ncbi:MAG TPA: peptide chain release factor N(5)-glutamine methyltransferase [Pseudolabrys sp.]|nr:peptide chain release factor N(5)-glutamine methyltransferase [Pseudolabrys sp.]